MFPYLSPFLVMLLLPDDFQSLLLVRYFHMIYCLLPNYVLNYDYKNKHYVNLMNGQTGKLSGSVPRSGVKIAMFVLFMILLVGGLGILFYLL